jgi:hypothetical protein
VCCRYLIFISVLTYLTCYSTFLRAQEYESVNTRYWIDFIPHLRLSDAFELYGDASFRVSDKGNNFIYVARPAIKYQASPAISIHLGVGFFYNDVNDKTNYLEIRPWQGLMLGWPSIKGLNFKHYIRLEQRYFAYDEGDKDYLVHRARYRFKFKIPINKRLVQDKTLYMPLGFEWLGAADDDIETIWSTQIRASTGIGYVFSEFWIIEFEYQYRWGRNDATTSFEPTDQVFRLRFVRNGWILGE